MEMEIIITLLFLASAILTLLISMLHFTKRVSVARGLLITLFFITIFLLGFRIRCISLIETLHEPLVPDAEYYFHISQHLKSPFQTASREPLFIWLLWFLCQLFGADPLIIRFLSCVLSLIAIWFTFFLGRRVFNDFVGLIAALLFATNPSISYLSLKGLRFELQVILFLLLIYLLFFLSFKKKIYEAILSGITGGIIFLSFLPFIPLVVLTFLIVAIKNKWRWFLFALSLILAIFIVSPYLLYCKQTFNDPFYAINIHSRYYRNLEFAGQLGFPSKEEFSENPYAGEHISSASYIFALHPFSEIIRNSIKGIIRIYAGYYTKDIIFDKNLFLFVMYGIGIFCLLFTSRAFILIPFFLWGILLAFPVGTVKIDWRIVIIFAPLSYCFAGVGIYKSVLFFSKSFSLEGQTHKNNI